MTQFCSKYWQIFQNLVSWTTFCICIKILADKRLVNNLIRGNLLSFLTYTKGQSMNWGKDSQLFLQISKKKQRLLLATEFEKIVQFYMFWIFFVAMFSFPSFVDPRTVTMRGLIFFYWALIQLATLGHRSKVVELFLYARRLRTRTRWECDKNFLGQLCLGEKRVSRSLKLSRTQGSSAFSSFSTIQRSVRSLQVIWLLAKVTFKGKH